MISLRRWPGSGPGWAAQPMTMRSGITAIALLGLATLAVQAVALLDPGSRPWAANLAWTLAGVVMFITTLTAGLHVRGSPAVRGAWLLYSAGAACWIIGALIRDSAAIGHVVAGADLLWLAFPAFCIVSFGRRVPRPYIFAIFLLDAIPVVLLVLSVIWTVQAGAHDQLLVILIPGLYSLLAANAIQMAGMHRDLRRIPATVWLFTLGFCAMALASLLWQPAVVRGGSPLFYWAGAFWTVGLLLVSSAALIRTFAPSAYAVLLPYEKQSGPHALPPALAVLGLIVLLTVTPQTGTTLRVFLLGSALALLGRVYLLRRQDLEQQRQLSTQNERLRELDRLKDDFIATVSHELRTPLTSIIGYVELMSDEDMDGLNADQRKFAEVIDRNAQRLLRLVGDLLFLSRIQSEEMEMEFRATDLADVVATAVEEARPHAQRKHIELALSSAPVPRFAGDPTRLAQLLGNLITNALKFTPHGGRVEVSVAYDSGHAVLAVADNGIGIGTADRERIFERFFRATNATQQAIPGTGLGLTVTKAIVEAHHGTITVDSDEGRGTTFQICLPLRPVPDLATQDSADGRLDEDDPHQVPQRRRGPGPLRPP